VSATAGEVATSLAGRGVVPGIALVVSDSGGVREEASAGTADRARTVPVTADTRFALASLTKPLVAFAALVARDRGIVDLDAPVAEVVGAVAPWITLRGCLAHLTGLPENATPAELGVAADAGWPALRDAWLRVEPTSPAGTVRRYSNVGYAIAGAALEVASGVPIDRFLREAVLDPLGMASTSLGLPPGVDGAWVRDAGLFAPGVPHYTTRWLASEPLPQSGGWATAADYARLLRCVLRGGVADDGIRVLGADACEELWTNQGGDVAGGVESFLTWPHADWAIGFEIRGTKDPHWTGATLGPAAISHFGASGTLCFIDRERDRAVVALACRGTYSGWMLAPDAWPAIVSAS
jgi:CubicO group peptidase (beta-lactamase class C family)